MFDNSHPMITNSTNDHSQYPIMIMAFREDINGTVWEDFQEAHKRALDLSNR